LDPTPAEPRASVFIEPH
jgi:ribonuclease HI